MKIQLLAVSAAILLAGCAGGTPTPEPVPQPVASFAWTGTGRRRPADRQWRHDRTSFGWRSGPASVQPRDHRGGKTRRGLFITHRVGDRLYFEIPARELNKDSSSSAAMRARPRPTRSTPGGGFGDYGGDEFAERTLRWERNGNRVILRSPSFAITADTALSVYRAVQNSNYGPIVAIFNVETYGPDSAAVVDVTRLFTTNVPELAAIRGDDRRRRARTSSASSRSPTTSKSKRRRPARRAAVRRRGAAGCRRRRGTAPAQSVLAHWSIVRLPEQPMMPRRFDERVGFFSVRNVDFGTDEQRSRAARVHHALAPRVLRPPDASGLCYPKKPIVYYVDPDTPDQWKPWIRKAILDWQPAFEAAGFKDGIVAADAPANDPDWSPEDIRHTMVRWLPSTVENARRPARERSAHRRDPQRLVAHLPQRASTSAATGTSRRRRRSIRARARFPFPDSLMGRLLEFVVAHEIGHTLGLQHDQIGSSTYPADSVRSPSVDAQDGPQPEHHGLLAHQLRRAARGPHRARRHPPAHRSVRQVRDHVGLQADSGRARRRTPSVPTLETVDRACRTRCPGTASRRTTSSAATARRTKRSATPIR